jgi:endonuclease/exonuclease/phosphatase (EEP) superfamily protein YafD
MICIPCSVGGDMNANARMLAESGQKRAAETSYEQAKFFHSECTDCFCQHVVGERLHD